MLELEDFAPGARLHGFTVESSEPLAEIDGDAIVMHHGQSGARLLFLRNADENKAFSISFKTPPADDTGVFHILEHSVLCGSDKFPVKEPFVNLLKTSMQTFLNALTFPDKTMYPVASTNDQDLENLMDVYMDAVLHPMIYRKRQIFEQEGWHYELDEGEEADAVDAASGEGPEASADDARDAAGDGRASSPRGERLRYNGVVFNEMKGALSDPDSVLYRAMNAALFPDSCYAFESGGAPEAIPHLTYEGYLDTHARHYRLDNAYIVLYGAIDADRVLGFLDGRYLSAADCAPRTPAAPNPMGTYAPRVTLDTVVPMDTAPENACVGAGYVIGDARDFERTLAVDVLLDALMGGNESPIKRAVLDAGLGGDATAYLLDSQAMPSALFQLKGAEPGVARDFMELVEREAARLVRDGIPRDLLEASLAQMAFDLRERDRGMADGVALAMNAMAGWLYDETPQGATRYLRYEDALAHMRAGLDTRYFEDVLDQVMVKSSHKALVEVRPQAADGEGPQAKELSAKLASMTEADKRRVRDEVAELRRLQEEPDSPEAIATLPRLSASDIGPAVPDPAFTLDASAPLPCLVHELPTRNIDYIYWYFDMQGLSLDDLPYVAVLASVLSKLDTDRRSAADLDVLMRTHLGSLRFFPEVAPRADDPHDVSLKFVVGASALSEETESLAAIPREVWESTRFSDTGRIRDILVQRRIAMEQSFANEGHACAANRLLASYYEGGVIREKLSGVDFYRFLKDLIEHFDERADVLVARLEDVRARLFAAPAVVSFAGGAADRGRFWAAAGDMSLTPDAAPGASAAREGRALRVDAPTPRDEAFIVPCDVCYVAKAADALDVAAPASGVWAVAANALSFDYLWNEVRVKGGAYGVGFRRTDDGFARFHSYRDPGVDATIERFDGAAEWVAGFDPDPADMEGYVVSTVATHDAPAKPRLVARREDVAFFSGREAGWRERQRAEKLATTPEQVRSCAPTLQAVGERGAVCVFGNEAIVRAAKHPMAVEKLF